jgi:hypothetical protein
MAVLEILDASWYLVDSIMVPPGDVYIYYSSESMYK